MVRSRSAPLNGISGKHLNALHGRFTGVTADGHAYAAHDRDMATYCLFSIGASFPLMLPGDWDQFSADLVPGMTLATVAAGAALYAGFLVALPFLGRA